MFYELTSGKWVLVAEITITVSILAVKASICCLYMQIFPLPWIRSTSITIIGVVIAYTIAHIVSDLTQCIPLATLWDPTITNAKCYPFSHQVIAMAIINIITDIAILLVPMKPIWGLMISRKRKWQLSVILSLGALLAYSSAFEIYITDIRSACIVGGIRIPFVKKMGSADETCKHPYVLLAVVQLLNCFIGDFVPAGIVSMVEPTVAIVAACLPACRPLLSRVFNISLGLRDFYSRPRSFSVFSSRNKSHAFELSNNSKNTGITKESAFEVGSVRSADDEERLVLPP